MQTNSGIKFFQNNEIDKGRWDECIRSSPNGLIYARTFYLDNICPNWSALTGENYEWVLPIIDNKKWNISYLHQPPFTQQSGVFAKKDVVVPFPEILDWLKQHYKFWEVNWNYATDTKIIHSPVKITAASNFILDLSESYQTIRSNYHNILIKNLKRSQHQNLVYQQTQNIDQCIDLYGKYYGDRFAHVESVDYKKFRNLCHFASDYGMVHCRQVLNREGKILALTLLLSDDKRLYNIINVTTEAGRKLQANHFLLDAVIREFAGRQLLFDFEGSDLPGVKSFYKTFGAIDQQYYMLKYNALPWLSRMFKK